MESQKSLKILILGAGKTGTSGIFHCIKSSAEQHLKFKIAELFEPRDNATIESFLENPSITKILLERFVKLTDQKKILSSFDYVVWIVRDPRDTIISRLMWQISTRLVEIEDGSAEILLKKLTQKEQDPKSISVLELYQQAAFLMKMNPEQYASAGRSLAYLSAQAIILDGSRHILRYEDFIDWRIDATERYLGFPLVKEFSLPTKRKRILRTASYGNWRNWFIADDYDFFVEPMASELSLMGYIDERPTIDRPIISKSEISEYIARVRRESSPRR